MVRYVGRQDELGYSARSTRTTPISRYARPVTDNDAAFRAGWWRRAEVVDSVMVTAIIVEFLLRLIVSPDSMDGRWGLTSHVALAAVAIASVPLSRRSPLIGLAIASVTAALTFLGHYPTSLVLAVPLLVLYHVGATGGRRQSTVIGLGVALGIVVSSLLLHGDPLFTVETFSKFGAAALPLAIGDAIRVRRALEEASAERLAQVEKARREDARRAVENERLRIARDLHDVVAHTLTMINVQAGVAAHLFTQDPEVARSSLDNIRAGSRDALDELRAMVGVLRGDDGTAAALAPAPRIAEIGQLAAQARANGVDVEIDVVGERPPRLADGTELAAYRIAQEALTNVVRHAGPVHARIRLAYEPGQLRLVCTNEAPATPPAIHPHGVGVGLIGMTERAMALGGTLSAHSTGDGGFHVEACLPYRVSA